VVLSPITVCALDSGVPQSSMLVFLRGSGEGQSSKMMLAGIGLLRVHSSSKQVTLSVFSPFPQQL